MYTSKDYPICAELKNKYSANRGWLSDRSLKADEQSIMGSGAISKEYTIICWWNQYNNNNMYEIQLCSILFA